MRNLLKILILMATILLSADDSNMPSREPDTNGSEADELSIVDSLSPEEQKRLKEVEENFDKLREGIRRQLQESKNPGFRVYMVNEIAIIDGFVPELEIENKEDLWEIFNPGGWHKFPGTVRYYPSHGLMVLTGTDNNLDFYERRLRMPSKFIARINYPELQDLQPSAGENASRPTP